MAEQEPASAPAKARGWVGTVLDFVSQREAVVTALIAIVTLGWGGYTFLQQQRDALNQQEQQQKADFQQKAQESLRPLFEKQGEIYFQAAEVAARLAIAPPDQYDPADVKLFEQFYWGSLVIIESNKVEDAMIFMRRTLAAAFGGDTVCGGLRKTASLNLASCMKESLEKNWGTTLYHADMISTETVYCGSIKQEQVEACRPWAHADFYDPGVIAAATRTVFEAGEGAIAGPGRPSEDKSPQPDPPESSGKGP